LACGVDLARRRPRKFRDEARVAENYLDTGLRALLAVAGVVMGLAWMPDPRYIAVPFGLLLAFRLALPLRRLAYPALLRVVGLAPDAGVPPRPTQARAGYTLPRAALLAVSLLLAALIGPQLVFTHTRYDLTIPTLHMLPRELVLQRQAELDAYVATPAGDRDAAALTELGLLLHERGLVERTHLARARTVLQRAMALDPGSAQAVAWYGSTLAAEALHEQQPVRRTRLVAEGLAYLDRAVAQAPDDPVVRLARASVCLGLPRFIGRAPTARADVDRLLELARTHPRESDPILPLVYQLAGDVYTLVGEPELARRAFEAALGEWPEPSTDYRLIAARLAALGGPHAPRQLAEGPRAAEARP
jgi:tetratricopeptide (TPR) repeat protein